MPITRKQFEEGVDEKLEEWMKKIQKFLEQHNNEAFSLEELHKEFEQYLLRLLSEDEKISLKVAKEDAFIFLPGEKQAFDSALDKLVEMKKAEKRIIRDKEYYSFWKKRDNSIIRVIAPRGR
jgi:uncharacterized protein YktB (UPF0637 family)